MTLRIGFLGIGRMGAPMAANLIAAGFDVTVWNRTRPKAEAMRGLGARVAESAASAAHGAQLLITMLDNGDVVDDVLFGGSGVAEAMHAGALVIDMSSIPPDLARAHALRLTARDIGHLDAPVSGGTIGASAGNLAIMVGGRSEDFVRASPALEKLGTPTYVGPSGAGQLAKLCNQVIVGVTLGAVSEALLLASAGGADPAAVRKALMGGFADSRVLHVHGERMLQRNFVPGGAIRTQLKDCETALAAAAQACLALPLTRCATELFRSALDNGGADFDQSAVLLEIERRNYPARLALASDQLPGPRAEGGLEI